MSWLFISVRERTRPGSSSTSPASLIVSALCSALLAVLLFPAAATATPSLQPLGTFDSPVYVTAAPGDTHRLFVVERAGRVRIVKDGVVLSTPFLDISSRIDTSRSGGLLSIAFPPNYSSTGRFYGYYTDSTGIRVAEFRRSKPDRAQSGSPRILLTQPRPTGDHFGGQLQFGPDGLLYISIGDGQDAASDAQGAAVDAQNLGSWWGKILRINPLNSKSSPYRVPADNPFVGTPGARPEIWAYGLRNPWRFSFDRQTGDLAIGDVGQSKVDEVDFAPNGASGPGRGANYGWNCLEGTQLFAPANCTPVNPVPPVLEKQHPATAVGGWCSYSITGGYIVRDPSLPSLNGRYLYGDFCTGEVRSAQLATPNATGDATTGISLPTISLSSFGEDASGHVYVVSLAGTVYRVAEAG
jgi:Glucose / Sorbosone dehydrogenase